MKVKAIAVPVFMLLLLVLTMSACGGIPAEVQRVPIYAPEAHIPDVTAAGNEGEPLVDDTPAIISEYEMPHYVNEEPSTVDSVEEEAVPAPSFTNIYGTFTLWHESFNGLTIMFHPRGTFNINLSFSDLGLDFNIPGNINIGGVYVINTAVQTVTLNVLEDDILSLVTGLTDVLLEHVLDEIFENNSDEGDDDFLSEFFPIIIAMVEDMLDEIIAEITDRFGELTLRFDGNFDRLYGVDDEDMIFFRL
ncbi:MAG: hypothetical protein FWC32_08315 [Firmicutes bacterium]|nr:hypothetical protein [Bacillota bacterium]